MRLFGGSLVLKEELGFLEREYSNWRIVTNGLAAMLGEMTPFSCNDLHGKFSSRGGSTTCINCLLKPASTLCWRIRMLWKHLESLDSLDN